MAAKRRKKKSLMPALRAAFKAEKIRSCPEARKALAKALVMAKKAGGLKRWETSEPARAAQWIHQVRENVHSRCPSGRKKKR